MHHVFSFIALSLAFCAATPATAKKMDLGSRLASILDVPNSTNRIIVWTDYRLPIIDKRAAKTSPFYFHRERHILNRGLTLGYRITDEFSFEAHLSRHEDPLTRRGHSYLAGGVAFHF